MTAHLLQAIAEQFMPTPPKRIGVAVSGGGDSVALLCLIAEYARSQPMEVHAVSIDHGLREAALEEVQLVTDLCGKLGLPHHIESWRSWDGTGNLMAEARAARYGLLTDWAHAHGVDTIALGHTANDQAETVMMRLARGAGVDGLSAMQRRRMQDGVTWLRPLLGVERRELRHYLQGIGEIWVEDPTNEDRDFERIRMRDALRLLEPLGLTTQALTDVAYNMSKAREALDWQTFLAAKASARISHGAVAVDLAQFRSLPQEISRRLLVRAIAWLTGAGYPPRGASVSLAMDAIRDGRTHTLEGCIFLRDRDILWLAREYNAIAENTAELGETWDNRWIVSSIDDDPEIEVRALGDAGLQQLSIAGLEDIPRAVQAVTPGVWEGDTLLAAPGLQVENEWTAELEGGKDSFFAALLSH